MYWAQRRLLSQNFLANRELVKRLIRGASISPQDTVLEIGPGRGIITQELLQTAQQVIAIELDKSLFDHLKSIFAGARNLSLIHGDFLRCPLPQAPYKVFSNIPFDITGEIIRKLLQANNPPVDCYLVIQREAASKFIANHRRNTLAAILYYPWWDIRTTHQFHRSDFAPPPQVDCVLLGIHARSIPLLSGHKDLYQDFVAYHFNRDRFATFVPPSQWLKLFKGFLNSNPQRIGAVQGAFARLQQEQRHLRKVHRTRTDPDWKRFGRK